MAFKKGEVTNPSGRAKGSLNKATNKTREAIARFADETVEDFIGWIKEIAIDDKKEAAKLYLAAIEYHIPKLARTESTMEVKGNLTVLQIMDEINGRTTGLPSSESKSE